MPNMCKNEGWRWVREASLAITLQLRRCTVWRDHDHDFTRCSLPVCT